MIDYTILTDEGILVINPHTSLVKEDFAHLTTAVDGYLSSHSKLHGVMIQTEEFPGWDSFGAFAAHMRFVKEHHQRVERVAIVTDSKIACLAEMLGKHFMSAEVKHFPYADDAKALDWLISHAHEPVSI
ncbi:MAG: STAS/SEC14 domain-containing protein [Burkholderiaceae bacterium]